jgi:hypothetical protein
MMHYANGAYLLAINHLRVLHTAANVPDFRAADTLLFIGKCYLAVRAYTFAVRYFQLYQRHPAANLALVEHDLEMAERGLRTGNHTTSMPTRPIP